MAKKLHLDMAAEREATDIGKKFMNSSDVVGDMSRAYGTDLSSVKIHTDSAAAGMAAQRGVDAFSTGKDVFFGRGAFDQNDPASRGLLAHELSHSLQQGVGGMGGMQQSAPMGAEQGGLIDWFRDRKKAARQARVENYLKSLPMDEQVEALSMIAQGRVFDENGEMDAGIFDAYRNVANSYADMTDENAGAFAEELARQRVAATIGMDSYRDSALIGAHVYGTTSWSAGRGYAGSGASMDAEEADYATKHGYFGRRVRAYDQLLRTAQAMPGGAESPLLSAVGEQQREQLGENHTMVGDAVDLMGLQTNGWTEANRTQATKMEENSNRRGWLEYKAWEKKNKQGWAPPKKHLFRRWLNR